MTGSEFAQARADVILAALADADPPRRRSAIALAARYLEPRFLASLVANGEDATLRNAALEALEYQGPYAVGQLRAMLADSDTDVVMFALHILGRIASPGTISEILPLVAHTNLNVAQAAIEALGRLRATDAVPTLLPLLGQNVWLQLAAIDALGEIGDLRAAGPLAALVPDSPVAEPAIRALERLAPPEALGALMQTLRVTREAPVRNAALLAVAAVLERQRDPQPAAREFGRMAETDRSTDGVLHYLSDMVTHAAPTAGVGVARTGAGGSPAPDDRTRARDGGPLLRAAATLAVAAGIRTLFRVILMRAAEPEVAIWAGPLFAQYAAVLAPDLPDFLVDTDPAVRQGALLAAPHARDVYPHLLQLLRDDDAGVRAAACRALGAVGDPGAIRDLVGRLREGSGPEREAAEAALGRMPGDRLDGLEPCLRSPDEALVIAALRVLAASQSPLHEDRAHELAHDPSVAVRCAALRVVAGHAGTRAEVALLRALADRDEGVQVAALELLVRRGGRKVMDTLLALLGTGDSLRYYIIRALGKLAAPEAAPRLRALYSGSQLHERVAILQALDRIGPPDAVAFFWECLGDADAEIRRVAARGVARAAPAADLRLLVTLADDTDWAVRNEAASGLGRLALPEARDVLLRLVRDVEPVVRQTARTALDGLPGSAV